MGFLLFQMCSGLIELRQFSGREFPCTTFIPQGPGYDDAASLSRECTTVGAVPGALVVDGDAYLATFSYFARNKWRWVVGRW